MATSSLTIGRQTLAAVRIFLVLTVLLGVVYPAAVWGVGRITFHDQAAGSLISANGKVIGSSLIGQSFTGPKWFHGRPSATDYVGNSSGGSNLPADDRRQQAAVAARQIALAPLGGTTPDALTMSASGLDPDISPAYARLQASSVAKARGLRLAQVETLIGATTTGRDAGFLGEPKVNVLQLNLVLMRLASER